MVQLSDTHLDASFAVLADATRRRVLEHLARGDASITQLADRFGMTLTGMKKHVSLLEQAGFVATHKQGRVRMCRLGMRDLAQEMAWIERYSHRWQARFDALDHVIATMMQPTKIQPTKIQPTGTQQGETDA